MKFIMSTFTLIATLLFSHYVSAEVVWIDVRSLVENKIDNIDGDIQISHSKIVEKVNRIFPDKNTDIKLYCRSGIRAGKALSALNKAGYTTLENVGSIDDARNVRSIPIK